MPLPESVRLELPILQELLATGGSDQVRYLYDRLTHYFPQLSAEEALGAGRVRFARLVQRTGRSLRERGELRLAESGWQLTERGRRRALAEALHVVPPEPTPPAGTAPGLSHAAAQQMLIEIGALLGKTAQAEYEFYDVVWRASPSSPRLSHVFEVQVRGSVDGALGRLKQAHERQRSRLFLVVADERSGRFVRQRLSASFHELAPILTIIGTGELSRLHQALTAQRDLLQKIAARD